MNKFARALLPILIAGEFVAAAAAAAPAVSGVTGTLAAGETVTIAGSSFGTKPQAAPVLWDDFENGTVGRLIQGSPAIVGSWDTGAGSENVFYSSNAARSGTKSSFHDFMNAYNASLAKNFSFTRLYMDFWVMADYVDRQSRNFKPWRMYGQNDSLQLDYVWLCNGQLMNRVQDSAGWSVGDWGGPGYTDARWMHIQLVYAQSSPGVADGTIRHFIDSQVAGLNSGAIVTEMQAGQLDQIRIGHYWDKAAVDACVSNSGARVYVDDVYIDTSWARVELGNASTYSASTVREIQLPTAWSASSISIKFNPGKFASGTTAYLYVTDASNVTSPGIPVRIGGSATAPNAPTAVTAR